MPRQPGRVSPVLPTISLPQFHNLDVSCCHRTKIEAIPWGPVLTIIHVGADKCYRLPVLKNAGYRVRLCASIGELREALESAVHPDAVLISEGDEGGHAKAVSLVRARTAAPIVLFRESQRSYSQAPFDMVVPILDPPEAWLADIAGLIARRRAARQGSQAKAAGSTGMRRQSAQAQARSRAEVQCSRSDRTPKISEGQGRESRSDGENE